LIRELFEVKRLNRSIFLILPTLSVLAALVMLRGDIPAFWKYLKGEDAYVGSSIYKVRRLVSNPALLSLITTDPDYQDFRRPKPDFSFPANLTLVSKIKDGELQAYYHLLKQFRKIKKSYEPSNLDTEDQLVNGIVSLANSYYLSNQLSDRIIDEGVLGKRKSTAEDYIFYLANAKSACGTVGEATVALLRDAGLNARLMYLSLKPGKLQANHIFPEYYSRKQKKWIMVDPLINFLPKSNGVRLSSFELLNDKHAKIQANKLWNNTATIGGEKTGLYSNKSVIWFDRRGLVRQLFYYTPEKKNHEIVKQQLSQS